MDGDLSKSFGILAGVRQGCVMSPRLFNMYMGEVIHDIKAKIGKRGTEMECDVTVRYGG